MSANVLVLGLDPDVVDFSQAPIPGMTAQKVRDDLETENARLRALGYAVTLFYVDAGATAESALAEELRRNTYDCILIGAGLRAIPKYFLLFEKLLNVVHGCAPPSTRLCFNTNPADTAAAVQRWV